MNAAHARPPRPFWILFALITVGTLLIVRPYLDTVLLSLTMVIILKPIYDFFQRKRWARRRWVALSLTLISFLLIVAIPIVTLVNVTISQARTFAQDISPDALNIEKALDSAIQWLQQLSTLEVVGVDPENVAAALRDLARQAAQAAARLSGQLVGGIASIAVGIGKSLPDTLIRLFLFFGFLITLLPSYDRAIAAIKALSPLGNDVTETYILKVTLMIKSMFLAIFALSIIQGLAMGLFYVIAGVPYAAFWTMISTAFAVVPLVGVSTVALPMAIILIASGQVWQGVIVLIGFYGFVNWIDNLLRPVMVAKEARINPLLLLLSVFGAMTLWGLIGVLYGPVIMIIFVTTIETFISHYRPDLAAGMAPPPADRDQLEATAQSPTPDVAGLSG